MRPRIMVIQVEEVYDYTLKINLSFRHIYNHGRGVISFNFAKLKKGAGPQKVKKSSFSKVK